MKIKEINLENIGGALARIGNVIYVLVVLSTAVGIFLDKLGESETSKSIIFLYTGLYILGAIVILEFLRRLVKYIVNDISFFDLSFPKTTKFALAVVAVCFSSSLIVYFMYDMPKEYLARQARIEKLPELIEQNKIDILNAKEEALKCEVEEKKLMEKEVSEETSFCRTTRLNYNACREYGSPTMCLSIHDYASACEPYKFSEKEIEIRTRHCREKYTTLELTSFMLENERKKILEEE